MAELPEELQCWTALPGPAKFLNFLHERLLNGGKLQKPLVLARDRFTEDERREIEELFGIGAVNERSVNLVLAQQRLDDSRFPVKLVNLVSGVFGEVITRSERKRARDAANTAAADVARQEMLNLMRDVPELQEEYHLLLNLPSAPTKRVPVGSRTRAGTWSTYGTAIRAAAVWWPRHRSGIETRRKGLAATALGGAKTWTKSGRLAFQNLIGMPVDEATAPSDTEMRLRGPLLWKLKSVIVDASLGNPWVSVPAKGIVNHGDLDSQPVGILLIENDESFEQACLISEVTARWLCVWVQGFASDGLIEFIRKFNDPILAAWCDLDTYGIEIIRNVMREAEREVFPVGMEPELWEQAPKRWEAAEKQSQFRRQAEQLAKDGPPLLRPLARAMATTGERVEQEELSVNDAVIPTLEHRLAEIEQAAGNRLKVRRVEGV
ncbi:Wadjet anti-phage system protein JetD domain-containing protein [Crossiella sp. CA198]|uniref:Wadjet anti-phage system protein JetD domain-containing protein n=1 Tax=Crossiella sp. CA198 TaxID=3455607 RepID=UPI003F8D231A